MNDIFSPNGIYFYFFLIEDFINVLDGVSWKESQQRGLYPRINEYGSVSENEISWHEKRLFAMKITLYVKSSQFFAVVVVPYK